ncbi:P-loop containing nucleoside triphosphate hydrolase protein [Leptodontidium sp. MPI-SDFR-AT-0119]|nr:P-loop containing nucleoside triphosphate hydrolase protein [Leptodontidium sp. MPI-SDFR-AT-0119]
MSAQWCGETIENSFGPTVKICRGGFDFTALFEQVFLSIIPSAIFLVLLAFRLVLLRRESPKVNCGYLLPAKIVIATTYATLQLYFLVRWIASPPFYIRTSIATQTLYVIDGLGILVLSPLEHLRNLKPSTLLQVYLLLTLLFDAAICRTLWLIGADVTIQRVFVTCVSLKFVLFCLEVIEKRRWLKPKYSRLKSEAIGGFVNLSVFWWLNGIFLDGFHKILVLADIEGIEEAHRAEALEHNLQEVWSKIPKETPHALLRALAWTLRWPLAASIFPRICSIGFKFSQPFLIATLIDYLDSPFKQASVSNGLIGAYALAYSGVAISTGYYWYMAYRTITMVRGSLIAMVYSHTLDLPLGAHHSSPSTLMSTDVERICTCLVNLHELWANVIEVGIAVYILEKQIGTACITPALIALACGLGTLLLTSRIAKRQDVWLKAVQGRLEATESTLGSIRGIKMMGLTDSLSRVIQSLREKDLLSAMNYRKLQVTSIVISLVMNITGPALTFTTFTIISAVRGSGTLLAAPSFASITVLALIGTPLITLFQALPLIRSAVGSLSRIQDFLNQPGVEESSRQLTLSSDQSSQTLTPVKRNDSEIPLSLFDNKDLAARKKPFDDIIRISEADITWTTVDAMVLLNINLAIRHDSLTMIIGPVGCGKSTLIKTILGETKVNNGTVDVSCQSLAFCDQSPWLTYATIRENVTGPANSQFDETWYSKVIHACALEKDLEQLPDGDQSMVGSRGIALSGGQRQRLSIARALYSRNKLAIFDDVLSGLDGNTEEQVFIRVFGPNGIIRQHKMTAILVTHQVKWLAFSSHIIAIDECGRISQQGDFNSLSSTDGYVRNLALKGGTTDPELDQVVMDAQTPIRRIKANPELDRANDISRQTGDFSLYKYYLGFAGSGTICFAFVVLAIYSFCLVFPTIWLDWWSTANEKRPGQNLGLYLGVYILLGVIGLVTLSIFCWQMIIVIGPRAGRKLHSTILHHALRAPLSFLSQTNMGVIMNRFSQDIQLIDFQVTLSSMSAAEAFSTTIVRLLVVCITAKYVASIIPFTLGVVYFIQKSYLRTSRQLRHLDLEAKAPIYTLFAETLDGLATIRAYGWQDHLRRRNYVVLDGAQKPFYLLNCVQRWLAFVLDMLLTVVSVLVVIIAVKLNNQTSGGSTGVALVNVLACHQHLAGFVQRWTLLETSIGAVSRIRAFALECPVETQQGNLQIPPNWPSKGSIEMVNVSASYKRDSPILRNVTCSIPLGSKIGVCGRTGSGKSSFILCLLQMLELSSGEITIDGLDLSQCSKEATRSAFITVPQDCVLFEGSVRFNLDPRSLVVDAEIEKALRKVGLWEIINMDSGLDAPMNSVHLSHGQGQLFALARAILSNAKLVILDEAASSVDRETNSLMQSLIRSEFANRTIICVDHNLDNILDYNKIAVFDGGFMVEFDAPQTLLQSSSKFRQMVGDIRET